MTGNDGGGGGQADAGGGAGETKGRGARHEGPVEMARSRFGIAEGEQVEDVTSVVTRNIRAACELALIISYPKLNFPSG